MGRSSGSSRRTQGILGGRSEQVVRRVLDAAIVELARSGYHGFRVDVVASRAAVNKTTIYRRWPSRAALVTALVDRMRAPLRESPLPDTGRLESDLVEAFARRFTFGRKTEGRAWARLLEEREVELPRLRGHTPFITGQEQLLAAQVLVAPSTPLTELLAPWRHHRDIPAGLCSINSEYASAISGDRLG